VRPVRVALTGGIATGKSVCLKRFAALGAATLDADVVARAVVAPGTKGLAAVVERFGPSVLAADGALDRQALGRLVFADEDARRALEAIIHPAVYAEIAHWYENLGQDSGNLLQERRVAVADVPLLYETGHAGGFDCVVVAACTPAQQLARLMARDRLDEAAARRRIQTQWPLEEKVRRADFVIDTSGSMVETEERVEQVWRAIESRIWNL